MRPDANALTCRPTARRTLAEVIADLAQIKARIDQTDQDLAGYWTHYLTLIQFNRQSKTDQQDFHAVVVSLRSQTAQMRERAPWASERQKLSPQEALPSQDGPARMPLEGPRGLLLFRRRSPASTRLPSSEAASTNPSSGWLPSQEEPGLN